MFDNQLYRREKPQSFSVFQFPTYKHYHHGQFQATNIMAPSTELEIQALQNTTVHTTIYFNIRSYWESLPSSLLDSLNHQRADSRSKKNYNPAACGTKTTFTERQTR